MRHFFDLFRNFFVKWKFGSIFKLFIKKAACLPKKKCKLGEVSFFLSNAPRDSKPNDDDWSKSHVTQKSKFSQICEMVINSLSNLPEAGKGKKSGKALPKMTHFSAR